MTIDLVPLKEFSARVEGGWKMIPGYELKAGDFAVTMMSPDHKPITNKQAGRRSGSRAAAIARFRKKMGLDT